MAKEPAKIGAKVVVDGEKEYKSAIADINKTMAVLASEARKTAAAYSDNKDSLEALQAQTDSYKSQAEEQRKKVEVLSEAYENSKKQLGENANATKEWLIKLNNAEAALTKTEKALENSEDALKKQSTTIEKVKDKFKEWEDCIDNLKEKHPVLTKAVEGTAGAAKTLASGGLKAVTTVGAMTGLVASGIGVANKLAEISEETKELRDNLGKLETAFTTNGYSAETATSTYTDLYSVLGDSDKATEAANHLALLTDSQKELNDWVNISTGVYGTFGDSLPIESLTEAANETAKTGQLTGALADALNWVGINEEQFQSKLDGCSTEQERQTLITETLNEKYSEAAEKYREVNDTLIEAQKAQADYNLSMAGLGEVVDKVKNEALASFLPGVNEVIDGLTAMLSGDEGAPELIKSGFESISAGIEEFLPKVKDILSNTTETVSAVAPEIISSLTSGIMDNLDSLLEAAFGMLESLCEGLLTEKNITQLTTAAIKLVLSLGQFLGENVDTLVDAAFTLIDGLIDGLLDENNAQKLVQTAFDIVQEIAGSIIDNAPELAASALQLGVNLLQGLWQGVQDTEEWLKTKVVEIGEDIIQWCKDALGIKSPSRRANAEIGKPFVQGIVEGIKSDKKNAEKSAGELGNVIVESAAKELETYKKYHEVTAADEAEFWQEIIEYTKEGTKGRIEAEEKYLEAVKLTKEEAIENIQELTNAYNEAVEQRQEALLSEFSLFDAAEEKREVSKFELQKNLNSQVKALEDYSETVASLSSRIDNEEFIEELQKMGVDATGELEALNSMTDKQLDRYVKTWEKRNALAREAAIAELEPLEEKTISEIKDIASNVAANCDGDYQALGRELILSISAGIENEQGTLNAAVNAAVLEIVASQQQMSNGSHAGGLDYVPYDGYRAVLHKGEKLLTASEAVVYDRNQNSSSNNDELNRKLDMLLANGQAPVNVNLVANGSNAAVVRALDIQIKRENKRASAFG